MLVFTVQFGYAPAYDIQKYGPRTNFFKIRSPDVIMPGKKTFADILKNLPPKTEQPNIFKEMGRALLRIPFDFWEERFYFRGALNTALREKTGHFPARLGQPGETHPVFLLRKLGNFGFQACPCTSKEHGKARYIRKDCLLDLS